MNGIVAFSLRHRVLMVLMFVLILLGGIIAFRELNIEAYPDPTPPMVDVITQSPGLSAEEIELRFDRDRDVALDLFGRQSRTLRDYVHHRRRGIGIGLDVELAEGDDPAKQDQHEHQHHQDAVPERKGDDPVHCVGFGTASLPDDATRSMNRLPFVTTRSPGARPLSTSTMLPLVSPTLMRRSSIAFSLSFSRTTQTRAVSPS